MMMRQDGVMYAAMGPHPLLVDMYGYCSVGLLSEFMMGGTLEDALGVPDRCNDTTEPDNHNHHQTIREPIIPPSNQHGHTHRRPWSAVEKLQFALNVAQAVALLHNNQWGVIVHGDLKLDQFLLTKNNNKDNNNNGNNNSPVRVKLNDFNLAEALLYDYQHNKYCQYNNHEAHGDVRTTVKNNHSNNTHIYILEDRLVCVCMRVFRVRCLMSCLSFVVGFVFRIPCFLLVNSGAPPKSIWIVPLMKGLTFTALATFWYVQQRAALQFSIHVYYLWLVSLRPSSLPTHSFPS